MIKHIQRTRLFAQRTVDTAYDLKQSRFGQRIEEIKHSRLERKSKLTRVTANGLEGEAPLRITFVLPEILLRHAMQFKQQFNSHDATKGIICCHQQHSTFS